MTAPCHTKNDLVVNIRIGNTSVPLTSNLAGAKTNVIPYVFDPADRERQEACTLLTTAYELF